MPSGVGSPEVTQSVNGLSPKRGAVKGQCRREENSARPDWTLLQAYGEATAIVRRKGSLLWGIGDLNGLFDAQSLNFA